MGFPRKLRLQIVWDGYEMFLIKFGTIWIDLVKFRINLIWFKWNFVQKKDSLSRLLFTLVE